MLQQPYDFKFYRSAQEKEKLTGAKLINSKECLL